MIALFFYENTIYFSPYYSYALVVTLSRLLSFSQSRLVPPHLMAGVLSALHVFLASIEMEKMAATLEEYQCNWITLAPFVDVFFAPIHHQVIDEGSPSSQEEVDVRSICLKISLKALAVEMNRARHRKLAAQQGLLDTLICLQWRLGLECQDTVRAIVELFKKDMEPLRLPPPRLHTLAAVSLAKDGEFLIKDTFNF